MITTVEQFVKKIGGNDSAARAFGVTAPAVCNWKADDRFPAWALMRVMDLARVNRLTLDTKLFATKKPNPTRRHPIKKRKAPLSAAE